MSSPPIELLTVPETAAALRCHKATVFRLLAAGELDRVKVGASTCIPRSSVDEFLTAHTEVRDA